MNLISQPSSQWIISYSTNMTGQDSWKECLTVASCLQISSYCKCVAIHFVQVFQVWTLLSLHQQIRNQVETNRAMSPVTQDSMGWQCKCLRLQKCQPSGSNSYKHYLSREEFWPDSCDVRLMAEAKCWCHIYLPERWKLTSTFHICQQVKLEHPP